MAGVPERRVWVGGDFSHVAGANTVNVIEELKNKTSSIKWAKR